MNYNKHVQLHGKPGSGFFLQPRYQKILQDVADKPEVRPQTKFARNKSKPTGTQSDHCAGRKFKPSPNNGANGQAVVENQQASGSVENNDIAFLDAKNGHAMDCANEARTRRLCQKTRARIGHRSMEAGPNPMRNLWKQWWSR